MERGVEMPGTDAASLRPGDHVSVANGRNRRAAERGQRRACHLRTDDRLRERRRRQKHARKNREINVPHVDVLPGRE